MPAADLVPLSGRAIPVWKGHVMKKAFSPLPTLVAEAMPGTGGALRTEPRMQREELAQGLYEIVYSPSRGAV
jgi:hypothetical protein